MAEVLMPKMGDGMEEGTINVWLINEGEMVQSGAPLAEVETDKANVEISAYETGILSRILVKVGETVPVGTPIAHIGEVNAVSTSNKPASPTKPEEAPTAKADAPPTPAPEPASRKEGERIKASPLARRMAKELGIDITQVSGTGAGTSRIVAKDIQAFHAKAGSTPAPVIKPASTTVLASVGGTPTSAGETIKPSKMREAIARRTLQSKQGIPHFYVTMVIEMDRSLQLVKDMNTDNPDGKITVNDIITKASAVALEQVPEVNATWTNEGTIHRYADSHIGIAVAVDEGLIIPVVRDCNTKSRRTISNEAKALIQKARANQLKPEEYTGGTFSLSNLGMMGVDEFIAIINPPEAAILAIAGIVREPVVLPNSDTIVIRSRMKVTLSADHRVLDGLTAARFLQALKQILEAPFGLVG